jgi:N-acetylmuramoyl-L-alanine amidase
VINIETRFLTNNESFQRDEKIIPEGIMVHSLGTSQSNVEPVFNYFNQRSTRASVHALVHENGVLQTLPYTTKAWHCGGSGNSNLISFEILEPSGFTYKPNSAQMVGYDVQRFQPYFDKVWKNATEFCAVLCKFYNLTEKDVICHAEGYRKGIASNHADTEHWFPKHGKTMNDFRNDVKKLLDEKIYFDNTPDRYAKEAIDWAVSQGILKGNGEGDLSLHDQCTRQDMLVFIHRTMQK